MLRFAAAFVAALVLACPARADGIPATIPDDKVVPEIDSETPRGPGGEPGQIPPGLREPRSDLERGLAVLDGTVSEPPIDPRTEPSVAPPTEPGAITPQQFGALCNRENDDSAAIDAWLNELAERPSLIGLVPKDSHCRAPNVVNRNFEVDTHLVVDGTLDLGDRKVGWGINAARFTIEGEGKITCNGGIAFITSPRNDYDFDGKGRRFGDFNPRMTRDIEQLRFDLAEWDGCTSYLAATYHPRPKFFAEDLSRFRIKRLSFNGWVHDAPFGLGVVAYKWGDANAMEIEEGRIVRGAPAFEIRGRFTSIRSQPGRRSGYGVRAVMVGSGRKGAKSTNGGLLVSITCDGVFNEGFQQNRTEGNETQCLRIEAGEDILVVDTHLKNVRWPGTGSIQNAEAKLDRWGKPVSNTECLYTKADKLWVVRTIFENCDGTGFDAMAWTDKGYGPNYGRDLTVRWTRPEWNRVFCRAFRLGKSDQTATLEGVTVEGHNECVGFGEPDRRRRSAFFGPDGTRQDRIKGLMGIPLR